MIKWLVIPVCLLVPVQGPASAEQLLFRDDFEVSVSEEWVVINHEGQRAVVDGAYRWTPTAGAVMNSALNEDFPTDISLRTRVRLLDQPQGDWVFIGLVGRDILDGEGRNYYGGIATDNRVGIGISNGGVLSTAFFEVDVVRQAVELKFDLIGDQLSISAWNAGTEPPEVPQVQVANDQISEGGVALLSYNPRNTTNLPTLAFDYFEVIGPNIDRGDFNYDGTLDGNDIDALTRDVQAAPPNLVYDLNDDKTVDLEDRRIWVEQLRNTWYGDSNLDGAFDSQDLVAVFASGQYEDEVPNNSTWSTGDWNGDADFDSGDFVLAFQSGGYEQGPRESIAVVPEPSTCLLIAIGGLGITCARRTYRTHPSSSAA